MTSELASPPAGRSRFLGLVLLVWGGLGLALIVAGLTVGLDAAARTETLISSSGEALAAASASTERAADALEGVGTGIGQAQSSSERAAALAADASATLDALAASMTLSILGTQPFLQLAGNFSDSADDAAALAGELDALGGSLEATSADTELLADELRDLAVALEGSTGSTESPPLRLGLLLVLVWVALPTLGALVLGGLLVSGQGFS